MNIVIGDGLSRFVFFHSHTGESCMYFERECLPIVRYAHGRKKYNRNLYFLNYCRILYFIGSFFCSVFRFQFDLKNYGVINEHQYQ